MITPRLRWTQRLAKACVCHVCHLCHTTRRAVHCRYLAPELLRNQHSSLDKADMFALGATLYELATGSPLPREGDRWHALRDGKLMMLPAVTHQLQTLIKVRRAGGEHLWGNRPAGWVSRASHVTQRVLPAGWGRCGILSLAW